LQPGIFGEQWYVLTPYLLIGGLTGATWLFARTVLGKNGSVLCWLALLFSIQFVHGARELFFWFNGGTLYTLFYSLSLLLYSLILRIHRTGSLAKRAAYTAGACVAAFVVGGGNYVTALLSCVLLAAWVGYRIIRKDRLWWNPLLALVCLAGALFLSMIAPGNATRQSQAHETSYLEAIFASFPHALAYFRERLRFEYVLGAIIALPFLMQAAERNACSFRYPGLVTLFSLGAYACQFTPHLATNSTIGPARLLGIIFFASFWMVGGNLYYWLGWAAKRVKLSEPARVLARWAAVGAAALLALACAATAVREPLAMNGVTAAWSLADGSARRYSQAQYGRVALYEDETIRDVRVPLLPEPIHLFMSAEIMEEETQWINQIIAEYYGKDSVGIAPVAE